MRVLLLLLVVGAVCLLYAGGVGLPGIARLDFPPDFPTGAVPALAAAPGGLPVVLAAAPALAFGPLPAPGSALVRVEGQAGAGAPGPGGASPGGSSERGDIEYVRGGAER